jgi:hypothetical protein
MAKPAVKLSNDRAHALRPIPRQARRTAPVPLGPTLGPPAIADAAPSAPTMCLWKKIGALWICA